ncbi:unnamed protein product, partial [marine sediment metagenome]
GAIVTAPFFISRIYVAPKRRNAPMIVKIPHTILIIDTIRTPTISFDKDIYNMGDTCYVTVQSEPNPLGRNTIYEFFVRSFYGTAGTEIIYSEKYIPASGTQAAFSFRLARGDKFVTVEATAFDAAHNRGGLPSDMGRNYFFVKDKNPEPDTYSITVFVRANKELISGATVSTQYKTAITDSNGKATLIGLPQDTYIVEAKKEGYGSGSETVVLDSDTSITIHLTVSEIDYLAIGIALIVFAVFAVAAIFVPGGIYVKLIVIILGAVLAIILYLFLGGII